ncbi:MAG: hypothetical protein ACOC33_04075 [bacterium]
MNYTLTFYECEHYGDIDYICKHLRRSGAKVINGVVDSVTEIGKINISISNKKQFISKLKKTDSYPFLLNMESYNEI